MRILDVGVTIHVGVRCAQCQRASQRTQVVGIDVTVAVNIAWCGGGAVGICTGHVIASVGTTGCGAVFFGSDHARSAEATGAGGIAPKA